MNGNATPLCSVCYEMLGKYGGPVTLPCGKILLCLCRAGLLLWTVFVRAQLEVCIPARVAAVAGHNGCLQCMATVRRSKSECPLCRQSIPAATELVINRELRDLVSLASALHTVDQDGWEAVTSNKTLAKSPKLDTESDDTDVTLVPTAPPAHVSLSTVLQGGADLLSLEPPTWLPDSHAQDCGNCQQPFRYNPSMSSAFMLVQQHA